MVIAPRSQLGARLSSASRPVWIRSAISPGDKEIWALRLFLASRPWIILLFGNAPLEEGASTLPAYGLLNAQRIKACRLGRGEGLEPLWNANIYCWWVASYEFLRTPGPCDSFASVSASSQQMCHQSASYCLLDCVFGRFGRKGGHCRDDKKCY